MRILGIDPGHSGGFALVGDDKKPETYTFAKKTEWDTMSAIRSALEFVDFAVIERVHAFPGQGVSSTFKFGRHYGFLRGVLTTCGIPWDDVSPATWQRSLRCLTKGDKNVTKSKAQQLWPGLIITHAIADALLIAEWGRREREQAGGVGASKVQ